MYPPDDHDLGLATNLQLERLAAEYVGAWCDHDTDRIVDLFRDECEYDDVPLGITSRGKDEIRAFIETTHRTMSEFSLALRRLVVAQSVITLESIQSGVHTGAFSAEQPTGKRYSVRMVTVMSVDDGRIARVSDYWDLATVLRQLGLFPTPGQR